MSFPIPPKTPAPEPLPRCAKCGDVSGDDWSQCDDLCPVVGSPFFDRETFDKFGDPLGREPRA